MALIVISILCITPLALMAWDLLLNRGPREVPAPARGASPSLRRAAR